MPTDHDHLLPLCRLTMGEMWRDEKSGHVVGCGDCTDPEFVSRLMHRQPPATLALQDPPYNLVVFERRSLSEYIAWSERWIENCERYLADNASLYVWLGADQDEHYQPLPQFMEMMSRRRFQSRSFITMRNQRGYGTQKNWMAVRQELLYYTKGEPYFQPQYTEIPKTLKGYYKKIAGEKVENLERSRSPFLRAGNVWVDIQQVFYRMEENVPICYAQKPLKAIERIIQASSRAGDVVLDLFSHAGTTLLACERMGRVSVTCDIDPVFAEVTIRRLERYRETGKPGWQRKHPFESDLLGIQPTVARELATSEN
ncbi:MAG: site-specific DNA-methyltransferase [candidate division Zixibacteria bacterium]|nr:site-specific DNA-methyltransferase [candidate division Zixibacteria bacterium]